MKVEKESVKAGLDLNIKKTNIMTTKEIHNFNVDNEDTEIVKRFCSVINSNGDCRQEIKRRMRRRRAAMEESGKITKGKGMSLESKVKIIYTLIFPINYVQMRKSVKKLIRKKLIYLKYGGGEEFYRYPGLPGK